MDTSSATPPPSPQAAPGQAKAPAPMMAGETILTRTACAAMVIATLVAGSAYSLAVWSVQGKVPDAPFVSMLIGATMILAIGARRIHRYLLDRGTSYYAFVTPAGDPERGLREYRCLIDAIMSPKWNWLSALVYGALVGVSPIVLHSWPDRPVLRALLCLFLFTVNFATGSAFYGLLQFCGRSFRLASLVQVDLWQREPPSVAFLLGASRRAALLSSVYVSLCISSILFSVLPLGKVVIAYAVFAAVVLLASLFVPIAPIVRAIRAVRMKALAELDEVLQAEYRRLLDSVRGSQQVPDLARITALVSLRTRVESINVWPYKLKSLVAMGSVLAVSAVPVMLRIAIEKFLK